MHTRMCTTSSSGSASIPKYDIQLLCRGHPCEYAPRASYFRGGLRSGGLTTCPPLSLLGRINTYIRIMANVQRVLQTLVVLCVLLGSVLAWEPLNDNVYDLGMLIEVRCTSTLVFVNAETLSKFTMNRCDCRRMSFTSVCPSRIRKVEHGGKDGLYHIRRLILPQKIPSKSSWYVVI
jgi:hypothetical protein